MKKFIFVISALLTFGLVTQVRAEMHSSSASGNRYYDNQVFTIAYNNSASDITSNAVVILDTTATAGTTLGSYITTTTTADDKMIFGVTDDATCASGNFCRVCIRGPHKVWLTAAGTTNMVAGDIVSTSTTAGRATEYSNSDGTLGGYLGRALGVVGNETTYGSNDGSDIWWVYISPQVHK